MAENDGDENTAFLLVAISDGAENSSSHYKSPHPDERKVIREIFEGAQATGRWTFNFLLCSEDDVKRVAQATGVDPSNMGVWSNKTGENAARAMGANRMKVKKYFSGRTQGITGQSVGFHSEEAGVSQNYDDAKSDQSDMDAQVMAFSASSNVHPSVRVASEDRSDSVFSVTVENQVLSAGASYHRPEWNNTNQS